MQKLTPSHKPGESHEYDITCRVCGQRGMVRLSVDPEREPNPDGTMEDALARCSGRVSQLLIENQRYQTALKRINGMDYRGNRSPEQDIARAALIEPDKTNPDGR